VEDGVAFVPFGARFLAEFRTLGGTVGRWKHATVMALEQADREEFLLRLRQARPTPSYVTLQAGLSDEPEALAKRVIEEERARAAASDGSALLMWTF
jgi:hypothetical protein